MSSPQARAEARRKAILSRGGDRLAKLTTSARGEDAPAYLQSETPSRGAAAFVGEESSMPPPPPPKETPRPSPPPAFTTATQPDPSTWSQEQQRQFMQALMGGALDPAAFAQSQPPQFPPLAGAGPASADDPFASMMAQLTKMDPSRGGAAGKAPVLPGLPKPPTRLQKFMPLIHMVCTWCLLAFFVLWKEPQVFVEKTAGAVEVSFWKRWPTLATQVMSQGAWGVQIVPFFWAFITLQIMLHSLRIFTGQNEVRPPALLAMALPHLPSPFPSLITNGMRYMRMGSNFMDDLAAVVFGIGLIIMLTSWFVDSGYIMLFTVS